MIRFILPLALGFAAAHTRAASSADSGLYSESCRCNVQDDYDLGPVMPQGKYKGQCQNTCWLRSATILRRAVPARSSVAPSNHPFDTLTVANILHGNEFYKGDIRVEDVIDVILHVVRVPNPMGVPAGHTQLRFRFYRPVHLVPQARNSHAPAVDTTDLIVSYEGVGPKGSQFDLMGGGLWGDFVIAYRVMTLEHFTTNEPQTDSAFGSPRPPGSLNADQYRLKLTQLERRAVLEQALEHASQSGPFQIYHSLMKNCATEVFDGALDPALKYTVKPHNPLLRVHPVWNPAALEDRGIRGANLRTLKDEMTCRKLADMPSDTAEMCLEL